MGRVTMYLDICCFNRPFDDQEQLRVRLETEAKLGVQEAIAEGTYGLAWSYMMDHENGANPFEERREAIAKWRGRAACDVEESPAVLKKAKELMGRGIRAKDALHVACAIAAGCSHFLSTDDVVLDRLKDLKDVLVLSPPEFIERVRQ